MPILSVCAGDAGVVNGKTDLETTDDTHDDATHTPRKPDTHRKCVRWPTAQVQPLPMACAGDVGKVKDRNVLATPHDTNMELTLPKAACAEDAVHTACEPEEYINIVRWIAELSPFPPACTTDPGKTEEKTVLATPQHNNMETTLPLPACREDAMSTAHEPDPYRNHVWWPTTQVPPIPSAFATHTGKVDKKNILKITHDTNMGLPLPSTSCAEDAVHTNHADSQPTAGNCTDDHLALKAYDRAEAKYYQLTTDEESFLNHDLDKSLDPTQEDRFAGNIPHPTNVKMEPVSLLAREMPQLLVVSLIWFLTFLLSITKLIINRIRKEWIGKNYQRAPRKRKDDQGK